MSKRMFNLDASNMIKGLTVFGEKKEAALAMYANSVAKDFETNAKENRPWQDRTGDAKGRLTGYTEKIPNGQRVNLAHGVDYGIWLELAMEKRYAILEPTVRLRSNEALKGLNNLLARIRM